MLGRRRQSIHGGFGQLSPSKSSGPFGRGLSSSHGRSISPRASSQNLGESNNRLSALAETPDASKAAGASEGKDKAPHDGTNGAGGESSEDNARPLGTVVNGTVTAEDIFDAPPPDGPPPQQKTEAPEPRKDAEGFTIPAAKDDPISQAEKEAAEETDQVFKLNIQKEPVAEEDADAKQAAMSNVANTLSMAMPSRKTGTIRGRRDVRNTIYGGPSGSLAEASSEAIPSPSPALSSLTSRPSVVTALASEASATATSDTQSVRSATSLSSLAQLKHPEMSALGLNSSIIETVHATFEEEGELKSAKVSGEIAFSYNTNPETSSRGSSHPHFHPMSAH